MKTDTGYCVKIFNVSFGVSEQEAAEVINAALAKLSPSLSAKATTKIRQMVTIRLPSETIFNLEEVSSKLSSVSLICLVVMLCVLVFILSNTGR